MFSFSHLNMLGSALRALSRAQDRMPPRTDSAADSDHGNPPLAHRNGEGTRYTTNASRGQVWVLPEHDSELGTVLDETR